MVFVVLKLLGFVLLTITVVPVGLLIRLTKNPAHILFFARSYFRILSVILGLRVHVEGAHNRSGAQLIVSNHISYLDIIALGAAAEVTFIPKSEIASWPVIGFLCKLIGCVFVDRRRSKTKENMAAIHEGLMAGKPLVLFAEGTTGSGKTMQPIRSSYFQLVEEFDGPLTIQPVKISYMRIHGLPIDEATRYRIAWVGDEDLAPHLLELLKLGPIDVEVHFLPEIDITGGETRKEIARLCEEALEGRLAFI